MQEKGDFSAKNVQIYLDAMDKTGSPEKRRGVDSRANVTGIRCRNNAQRTPEYRREQDTNKQPKSRPLIQGWECGRR